MTMSSKRKVFFLSMKYFQEYSMIYNYDQILQNEEQFKYIIS